MCSFLLVIDSHARIGCSSEEKRGSRGPGRTALFRSDDADRAGAGYNVSSSVFLQKRFAGLGQPFFEPFRTIAIGARPGSVPFS
jgi:hypothetical protein